MTSSSQDRTSALRIGLLGASRIAVEAVIAPAAELGHRVVAVAARDRDRAEAYATEHHIERVLDSYQDVIDDPEVDVVYNGLTNSLHGPWNRAAAAAGKAVFSEKPFARNGAEAREVAAEIDAAGVPVLEAFHFYFHPSFVRSMELIATGAIGRLSRIDIDMSMPTPPATDARWSYDLAGGAMMDLGCYALHLFRTVGDRLGIGSTLAVTQASCEVYDDDDRVDSSASFEVAYPDGVVGAADVSMVGDGFHFTVTYTGDRGTLHVHDFPGPHRDDRLTLTAADGSQTVEHAGTRPTYAYQLEALADSLRGGTRVGGTADSVGTMALIDDVYRAAGLPPR